MHKSHLVTHRTEVLYIDLIAADWHCSAKVFRQTERSEDRFLKKRPLAAGMSVAASLPIAQSVPLPPELVAPTAHHWVQWFH